MNFLPVDKLDPISHPRFAVQITWQYAQKKYRKRIVKMSADPSTSRLSRPLPNASSRLSNRIVFEIESLIFKYFLNIQKKDQAFFEYFLNSGALASYDGSGRVLERPSRISRNEM